MLLETDLHLAYGGRKILDGFRLEISPGEIVGLAGESGSGKSSFALALLGLLRPPAAALSGTLGFRGVDLLSQTEAGWRALRGREIALIPQMPHSALNPALSLETQARLIWRAHASEPWSVGRDRLFALMRGCNLPADEEFLRRLPGQISVGQAQRFVIALAVLHRPSLLIGDELTSSLDNNSRHHVLITVRAVLEDSGAAMLFLSHDLGVMRSFCQSIAVLHEGRLVERQTPENLFRSPRHPFTQRLIALAGA